MKKQPDKKTVSAVMRAMTNKRWAKATKEQRSAHGKLMVEARWKKRSVAK